METKSQTPEEIYDNFVKLFENQDFYEIADLFSDSARLIPPHNQPDVAAKEAIKNYNFMFRRHENYALKFKINEVIYNGNDHATVKYSWTGDGNLGKYTFDGEDEVSRQTDGTWLIELNHAFAEPRYEDGKPIDFEETEESAKSE